MKVSKEALAAADEAWKRFGVTAFAGPMTVLQMKVVLAEALDAFAREHAADAWDYKEQHGRACTFEDYWAWKVGEK